MFRFNAVTIGNARAFYNTLKDRELDLRGHKAIAIENMGILGDQFDTLDMSDNEILKLENFPVFRRLRTLLLNNNNVRRVDPNIGKQLVELRHLVLTNNKIANFGDIDNIASFTKLVELSLVDNPVVRRQNYRLYVIYKMPQLRLLDFRRIRPQERESAKMLFSSEAGNLVKQKILEAKSVAAREQRKAAPTKEQLEAFREAVRSATSQSEINRLERMARAGRFPSKVQKTKDDIQTSSMDVDDEGKNDDDNSADGGGDGGVVNEKRSEMNEKLTGEETKTETGNASSTSESKMCDDAERPRDAAVATAPAASVRGRRTRSMSSDSETMAVEEEKKSGSALTTKTTRKTRSTSVSSTGSTPRRGRSARSKSTESPKKEKKNASKTTAGAADADGETSEEAYTKAELTKLRCVDLRKILKSRGMATKGRKADLIGRLEGAPKGV